MNLKPFYLFTLLFIGLTKFSFAQMVIQKEDNRHFNNLTTSETKEIEKLKKLPGVAHVEILKFDPKMNLEDQKSISFVSSLFKEKSELQFLENDKQSLTWIGKTPKGQVFLNSTNNIIVGQIFSKYSIYDLRQIGKGKLALISYNKEFFNGVECGINDDFRNLSFESLRKPNGI